MKTLDLTQLKGLDWKENGQSNLSGDLLRLFMALDGFFVNLAAKVSAEAHKFPVFIQAKELNKLDYFSSFPHLITFPVALKNNDDNLKKFVQGGKFTEGRMNLTEIDPICDCLTPAACYHFYIHLQGQTLPGTKYLTTQANCFRREEYYRPLQRQWCFNMREIVSIGAAEDVKNFLGQYKEVMTQELSRLKLQVRWETATDPFFDPNNNPKKLMQQLDPVKEEMIFGEGLSIGSINNHKNYFGDNFDIKYQGEAAFSGCVAFGLERWLFAILTTYGMDSKNWPWKELQS